MKVTIPCLRFILIFAAILWPLSLQTDRNLDFWFTYFKDAPVDIPMWMPFVATVLLNGAILVLNLIGELARFAI